MADTREVCAHKGRANEVVVGHVDRRSKQSEDTSVQVVQSSIIIVTTVTKETICNPGLSDVYLSGPDLMGPKLGSHSFGRAEGPRRFGSSIPGPRLLVRVCVNLSLVVPGIRWMPQVRGSPFFGS
jgi:hypothetical protein